jgi:NAD(P)-dependent dehydrogenase (short-subunit alcohol dehydrogenase family)
VAVVLGGTTGIGRALSLGLAQAGADVVPSARRREPVEEVAGDVERLGGRTVRVTSEVTERSSLERLLDATVAALDHVDILVNCAGKTRPAATSTSTGARGPRASTPTGQGRSVAARSSGVTCPSVVVVDGGFLASG